VTDSLDGASAALARLSPGGAGEPLLRTPVLPWATIRSQLWVLVVALLVLVLTAALQVLSVAVHTLTGHTMVATATGLIGALATLALAERAHSTRQPSDLLMALALAILSATDLIVAAGLSLVNANPEHAWQWVTLAARLAASAILIGAAFCPKVDLRKFPRLPRAILAASASALALVAAAMLLRHAHLPSLLASTGLPGSSGYSGSQGQPLSSYVQISGALLAASAALGLAWHSGRGRDGLRRSVAAGVIVLAVAQLDYLLAPAANTGRLYGGDILTLGACLAILYGCLLEFRNRQRDLMARAAMDERRRMARDMHDGLAQELAFIATHSQRLGQTGDDARTVAHLRAAAERALHDSRTTIAVLTSPDDAPLDRLITRTVESFRSRFGVEVELDLEQDVVADAERRNTLLRILHEALTNAVRHGSARQILVRLRGDQDGYSLKITDDGCGFDVAAALSASQGLGLISMGERAELLGGGLQVISSPGTGTVVEVGLP
jgi:signal transduction histidine kinase